MGSSVDWTQVMVALIAGLPATLAVVFSYLIRRQLRTPSGETIGVQVEQANHLAVVNTELTKQIHETVKNGAEGVAPDAGAA